MPKYEIRGLYGPTVTVLADTEQDARLGYHVEHPGWAGTIFTVKELDTDE